MYTQWAHFHHVVYVQRDTLVYLRHANKKFAVIFLSRKQWCSLLVWWRRKTPYFAIFSYSFYRTPFTSSRLTIAEKKIKDEGKMCNLKQTAYMYWGSYSLSVFEHIMQIFITIKIHFFPLHNFFSFTLSFLFFSPWKFHKHLNVVDYSSLWKI